MIVVFKNSAALRDIDNVSEKINSNVSGIHLKKIEGEEKTILAAVGNAEAVRELGLESMPGVEKLVPIAESFKLAAAETVENKTSFTVSGATFGGGNFTQIIGPCTVESEDSAIKAAKLAADAGASMIRAGVFKPRTSPFSFQGPGRAGIPILSLIKEETGLGVVSELVAIEDGEALAKVADVIQIGTRNMQNYPLLDAAGKLGRPVLLKRGLSATLDELLQAADYILSAGEERVILCERGIRTFDSDARFTLDLGSIPILQEKTHLPVIVDPSHAAGRRSLVLPYSRAAVAVGVDGLIVEATINPDNARCDANQQLDAEQIGPFVQEMNDWAKKLGKKA